MLYMISLCLCGVMCVRVCVCGLLLLLSIKYMCVKVCERFIAAIWSKRF